MHDLTQHSWQLVFWFSVFIPMLSLLVFDIKMITKVGKFFQFPATAALIYLGFLENINGWHILWGIMYFIGAFSNPLESKDDDFPLGARIIALIFAAIITVPMSYLVKACGAQIW